jgi:adenylate cyclase
MNEASPIPNADAVLVSDIVSGSVLFKSLVYLGGGCAGSIVLGGKVPILLDQAEIHNNLVLAMNPNDPRIVAQRGELLSWFGRPDEGVEWIEKAMRTDPYGAPSRAHLLSRALYSAQRYGEAIEAFRIIVSPNYMNLVEAAACHSQIVDQKCATELADAAMRLNPDFTVDRYIRNRAYQISTDATHLAKGLRAAGLPA